MGTADDTELLGFEDFRREVGASEYSVRLALAALDLAPVAKPGDRRGRLYRREWIASVQAWLEKRGT